MEKEILTMEEAAELFGVSIKTFIKLLKEEKIPARKIGREWRFSRAALIQWLSTGDSQAYSSSDADAREFFNEVAPSWEEIRKSYYDESIKNKIFEMGILKKDMTAVDLGAGDGYITRSIAESVAKVVAVDISHEMLKELQERAVKSGLKNIDTLECDGQDVPVQDSTFDIAFANMYLHHFEQPETAVKEMSRIVKKHGVVFLADFYEHNDSDMMKRMHDVWPGFNPEEIKKWFIKSGFKNIKLEDLKGKKTAKNTPGIFIITAYK